MGHEVGGVAFRLPTLGVGELVRRAAAGVSGHQFLHTRYLVIRVSRNPPRARVVGGLAWHLASLVLGRLVLGPSRARPRASWPVFAVVSSTGGVTMKTSAHDRKRGKTCGG